MNILTQHDQCVFVDEHNKVIPHQRLERSEQIDALTFIDENATVLELGARYGTVSCLISRILKDLKRHVAVEPDKEVLPALEKNRESSGAEFQIFPGVISSIPVSFVQQGYSSIVVKSKESGVPTLTFEELQKKYSLKFDTLVADCEGCIESFVRENDLSEFRLILLEKDQMHRCNYSFVDQRLTELGFVMVRNNFNEVYRSVYVNLKDAPFKLLKWNVSHGSLGLQGKLGYLSENELNVKRPIEYQSISAHAPSKIELELKTPLELRGMIHQTSKIPPKMTFSIDGNILGSVNQADVLTDSIILQPGRHILEITSTNHSDWGHSIWLYKSA